MEPAIRYAETADGVSIAYYDIGEGAPLVVLPTVPWSNIHAEFSFFRFHPALASTFRLIRYDVRGAGLSQRDVSDYSLPALQGDLAAVLDRVDADRVNVYAEANAAKIALAYAAAHPERVERLVLWSAWARGASWYETPRGRAVQSLAPQSDWELYTETVAQTVFGFGKDDARWYAAYMRDCVHPEQARAYFAVEPTQDVTDLLSRIDAPSLVLSPSAAPMAPAEWGRQLASRMPHAQLRMIEADVMWSEEIEASIIESLREFVPSAGGVRREDASRAARTDGPFQTILFTDMESSTAETQRLGDAGAQNLVRTHNLVVREALRSNGGREVKHTGDGIMASFASVSSAVACAIDVQRAVARMNEDSAGTAARLKIGLNAGEPVAEDGDLFGTAVQLARRICDHAAPEQILVPEGVRHLVAGKNFLFADAGETALRGFEDPVRLYEVKWRE